MEQNYYIGVKIGKQSWYIHKRPYIITGGELRTVGKYVSMTMFNINVSRHQRKVDWLFTIIKCSSSRLNAVKEQMNEVIDENDYVDMDDIVLLCKLSGEKLDKYIKECVKNMEKYYTSMFRKRLYKFKYLKKTDYDDIFMIDLHTFEDMPESDMDCSFNKIRRFSVSFSQSYFNIKS